MKFRKDLFLFLYSIVIYKIKISLAQGQKNESHRIVLTSLTKPT